MEFKRVYDLKSVDGYGVPAYLFESPSVKGGAVVCHGYGGCKEEMLGLGAYLAEAGYAALCIDLRGHGENMAPLGAGVLDDLEAGLAYLRRYGRVAAVGQSLGGRLALMSSADIMVAISPAVVQEISPQGQWMFQNFPSPAVREPYPGYVIELLEELGEVPHHDKPCLLLYAVRDIPQIIEGTKELAALLPRAELREITINVRPDVDSELAMVRYLPRWFNHSELKVNVEVLAEVPQWLEAKL